MKPAPFTLHRATSIAHAVGLLERFADADEEAKVIAGGQSLTALMNLRLARPDHLVDMTGVAELHRIVDDAHGVRIGSMVTQAETLADPVVTLEVPLLSAALAHIGHTHIRNRGTVGGSIAHADPAAELPVVALALDAELVVVGPAGRRGIPAAEFFEGPLMTALGPADLLVDVVVAEMQPRDDGGQVEWGFEELARRDGDFATVLVATVVWRDSDGSISDARVALGGVGPTPLRSAGAESALIGTRGAEADIAAAAVAAAADASPTAAVHASAEYRRDMVEVLVRRSLTGARLHYVEPHDAHPALPTVSPGSGTVVVNGEIRSIDGIPDRRLLADWLRDDQGLTGTHLGCEHGVCGACTVLLDGRPVRSCLMFTAQAEGHDVTTIEALGTPDDLHPVQEAFRTCHGLQCGFCTPGMVLTTVDLLRRVSDPSEQQVREELSGNICRCTGYVKIIEAVQHAAEALRDG